MVVPAWSADRADTFDTVAVSHEASVSKHVDYALHAYLCLLYHQVYLRGICIGGSIDMRLLAITKPMTNNSAVSSLSAVICILHQ